MSWYFPIPILALVIAIIITRLSFDRRSAPGAASLVLFACALAAWWLSLVLNQAGSAGLAMFWTGLGFLAATLASTALLTFALEYTDRRAWLTAPNLALLAIEPALTQILFWSTSAPGAASSALTSAGGPWFWVNTLYSNGLVLAAIFIMVRSFVNKAPQYRLQSGTIMAGALAPILASAANLVWRTPAAGLELAPAAFTITGMAIVFGLSYHHLLDDVPITRDLVVEGMSDGWVVLDTRDRIVDLNPAAEEVIGQPREKIYGQPAENILSDWPNLIKQNVKELEIKGSVNMREGGRRYLNLRISPLTDRRGQHLGRLIVWRDITERRKAEDARQRARDEMFSLLHAISGAASRSQSLDDFLTASMYQIIYSFESQASLIFLLDEASDVADNRRLLLAAHHGVPVESVDAMSAISDESEMVAWVLEQREPLLIPDLATDARLPAGMRELGQGSFLAIPMSTEGELVGMVGLVRREAPTYTADEIARLTVVADEVATLIHSDRRRQLAIALAERQRLVRDLHDSVTQKLYGLVTLTEAAQAGLEAGAAVPAQMLSRIGENARQALKEMRLFLHELQPVDLERQGLVAVLHQRLAAVEGRSDVKARLLTDDNSSLSLSLDKEVALYFIAQEALNNVLRHARAKSVTVRLKEKKENITLEVIDDGCGFDPEKSSPGSMGLRNIKERTSQIGGRLKLTSVVGKGTRVSVTVRRDKR